MIKLQFVPLQLCQKALRFIRSERAHDKALIISTGRVWAMRQKIYALQIKKIACKREQVFMEGFVRLAVENLLPVLLGNNEPGWETAGLRIAERILFVSVPAHG